MKDWSCVNLKLFLDDAINPLICNDLISIGEHVSGNHALFAHEKNAPGAANSIRQAGKGRLAVGYFSFKAMQNLIQRPANAFKERNMLQVHSRRALSAIVFIAVSLLSSHAQAVRPETVAAGLQNPWGVAFLPDGRFLVTERPGRLRVVQPDGKLGAPVAGLPEIAAGGQGGLLDVVLDGDFARNRSLYFCFSEPASAGNANSTALARATLSVDHARLEDVKVIFSQRPKVASSAHFGCRIVESRGPGLSGQGDGQPDGKLFLTLGERFSRMEDAQKLDNHHGKIVRINKDGSIPKDNPFVGRAGALPEIWSHGHRNPQGATLAPDGTFWMHEHGPQGGDEINLPRAGANYGWPVITYGENYGGGKIGEGLTSKTGMEQPLHYWVPSIAPSGMAFLTSER